MEPTNVKSRDFRTAFVLLLVAAVTALFLAVIWPFLKPLLLGALLAGLCQPLYRWVAVRTEVVCDLRPEDSARHE